MQQPHHSVGKLINRKLITTVSLTNAEKRHLKSLAHSLQPVVRIGQKGVTDNVLTELSLAMDHHELVKVKVGIGDRTQRSDAIQAMASATSAEIVQQIGQTASLFRRNAKKPVIVFPR